MKSLFEILEEYDDGGKTLSDLKSENANRVNGGEDINKKDYGKSLIALGRREVN